MTDLAKWGDVRFPELLSTAHEAADAAGKKALNYFRQEFVVQNKLGEDCFDPVTRADKEAEAEIRKLVEGRWPAHGIRGEEFDDVGETSPFQWIIDPIDGTRAFIMGFPDWGTLIGLTYNGEPVLGLMDQPFTKERFWAEEGESRYRGPDGERALSVRACAGLDEALLATTSPDFFEPGHELQSFMDVKARARMTRYGGDCYSYCLLAAGHIDVIVEAGLKAHDIMPLVPIVQRAGGVITSWTGESAVDGGRVIAAGSRSVHAEAIELLSGRQGA